jgi:hypothetical protein
MPQKAVQPDPKVSGHTERYTVDVMVRGKISQSRVRGSDQHQVKNEIM